MRLICISALLVILSLPILACIQPSAGPQEENQRIAKEFVKREATFQFDGIPDTLKMISITPVGDGWEYTIGFDSQHAGYGNRSGQVLAEMLTSEVFSPR